MTTTGMFAAATQQGGTVTTSGSTTTVVEKIPTTVSSKLNDAVGVLMSTNVLHLAGIAALAVLLGLGRGPSTAEYSGLALLVGLGINTNKVS